MSGSRPLLLPVQPRHAMGHGGPLGAGVLCAASLAVALVAVTASADERPASGSAPPVRIDMRSSVEVAQGLVVLGDVAWVSGSDLDSVRRLRALPLGQAPKVARRVRLQRDALMRWVRARTGIEPTRVEWCGSAASSVRLAVRPLAGADVARRAAEAVRDQLSVRGLRAEVTAGASLRDLQVPVGALELRVRPIAPEAALAHRLSVWVDVWVDGRFVQTVPVALELAVFGPAHVATENLPLGSELKPPLLEEREVEWSGRAALPVKRPYTNHLRLRRPLPAGEVLTRAMVEPSPLVSRGGWATLHVRQGVVQLEGHVEVLQDGFSGQAVRVRLAGASGAVSARVIGPGALEVLQ